MADSVRPSRALHRQLSVKYERTCCGKIPWPGTFSPGVGSRSAKRLTSLSCSARKEVKESDVRIRKGRRGKSGKGGTRTGSSGVQVKPVAGLLAHHSGGEQLRSR